MKKSIKKIATDTPLKPLKVDELNLQDAVRGLREAGLSYLAISNELNAKKLQSLGLSISPMSVMRWCNRYMPEDFSDCKENAINIYRHACSLLRAIDTQLDILDTFINSCTTDIKKTDDVLLMTKQISSLMQTYEKLSNRKINLLSTIGDIQSKVYSYMSARDIVSGVLESVRTKDITIYAEVVQEVKSDPMLAECFRKIEE